MEGHGKPGLLPKGVTLDQPVALLSFLGKGNASDLLDLMGLYTLSACRSMSIEKTAIGGLREGAKGCCWTD